MVIAILSVPRWLRVRLLCFDHESHERVCNKKGVESRQVLCPQMARMDADCDAVLSVPQCLRVRLVFLLQD